MLAAKVFILAIFAIALVASDDGIDLVSILKPVFALK
jgi:hypothetical protein